MIPIDPRPSSPIEGRKVIIAEHQEGVRPLPAWITRGMVVTRWRLNDEERRRIADGADLWMTILTDGPVQPVALATSPQEIMEGWPE